MLTNISLYAQEPLISENTINVNTKKPTTDSIANDSISKTKGFLEAIVNYTAKDFTSVNQKTKQIYLYNEAQIKYQDM